MITGILMTTKVSKVKEVNDQNNGESSNTCETEKFTDYTTSESYERSVAIERAYVHEVYESCCEHDSAHSIRSRVAQQFISGLEPGSFICDVGCGSGRYLTGCNPSIFSIGVERCSRLAKVAKATSAEITICDNLSLPFKDESFDAVLSLSVIHHFATKERRISAIQELARVLRVGGKIILSVWAFEQKSRRFNGNSSQDILIPWQSSSSKSKCINSDDDEDDDLFLPPYHAYSYHEDSLHSNSSRSQGDGDSSSLSSTSSPNDTCYTFVRKALQKLAGGRKNPLWGSKDNPKDFDFDYEDAKDFPIELRRLEDLDDGGEHSKASLKSRSLGSILLNPPPPPIQIVRSQSSVATSDAKINQAHKSSSHYCASNSNQLPTSKRPKLIKQKQSISDEVYIDEDKYISSNDLRLHLLRKQSSLNEELMAENRIREKERIRKKIHKQISLNETFLCQSLFTKRLLTIREGFTSKFKASTGSLERATDYISRKIKQNTNKNVDTTLLVNDCKDMEKSEKDKEKSSTTNLPPQTKGKRTCPYTKQNSESVEKIRRESESDSSKENSLQSDTSIESEDSFASVIHIPKKFDSDDFANISNEGRTPEKIIERKASFELQTNKKLEPIITDSELSSKKIKNDLLNDSRDAHRFHKTKKLSSFPLVKRLSSSTCIAKNITVPKLLSLDLFNPELDDLDSESSNDDEESSSTNSLDSVINNSLTKKCNSTEKKSSNEESKSELNSTFLSEALNSMERLTVDKAKSTLLKRLKIELNDHEESKERASLCEIDELRQRRLMLGNFSPQNSGDSSEKDDSSTSSSIVQFSQNSNASFTKRQQTKLNDFILEESEDSDDNDGDRFINDMCKTEEEGEGEEEREIQTAQSNTTLNDTTFLIQEDNSDAIASKCYLKNYNLRLNQDSSGNSNTNSFEKSNNSASLDSPSGGSATHHVFHHVFRQNELDELITKNVNNLHIVSSYYDAKSWFVVCEKVQVWTI